MKKITYLVAPLMVLPFLVGCNNKATTYSVKLEEFTSENLKFTDEKGKEITAKSGTKATKGKNFVFNVTYTPSNDDPSTGVAPQGIFVTIGGYRNYNFNFEQGTDTTKAKVTIDKKDVTGNITLSGLEGKDGYYICDMPFLFGTALLGYYTESTTKDIIYQEGAEYGYVPLDGKFHIIFSVEDIFVGSIPNKDNVWLMSDKIDGIIADVSELLPESGAQADWLTWEEETTLQSYVDLTIKENTTLSYLVVAARGRESSLLNELSWDEIATLSHDAFAQYLFELGEKKTVEINGIAHIVRIVNIDTTTGELTFQFGTAISDTDGDPYTVKYTNASAATANNYNFKESRLNSYVQSTIYNKLPDDLKRNMKEVVRNVKVKKDDGWEAQEFSAKLYPLSYTELGLGDSGEGTACGLFNDTAAAAAGYVNAEMARRVRDGNGTQRAYWTRSSDITSTTKVYNVSVSGREYSTTVTSAYAVAPAFVI